MQQITIEDFCKSIGLDAIKMKQESFINVEKYKKQILSYNHTTGQNEYRNIVNVIRKKDDELYIVKTTNSQFEGTKDHKFYTNTGKYLTLETILFRGFDTIKIQNQKNEFEQIIDILPTGKIVPIYDLEVENNHNLFTNNLLSHNSMGDPTTVSGGKAIPFYAHVRIRITRSEIDRENMQNVMKFTVIKNKLAPPFKVGTVVYKWNKGFDFSSEVAQLALEFGIIKKEGNTHYLPDLPDEKFVGKKKLIAYLDDNEEYTKAVIEPLVLEVLKNSQNLRQDDEGEHELT